MTYFDFSGVYERVGRDHFKHTRIIDEYIKWLKKYAGKEETDWYWDRGDLIARGVFIKDPKTAVMFKLRFEI